MLRWSPDAWELRNTGLHWYTELSFIHSFIQDAFVGNLWHTQPCVRCQRNVKDESVPSL